MVVNYKKNQVSYSVKVDTVVAERPDFKILHVASRGPFFRLEEQAVCSGN